MKKALLTALLALYVPLAGAVDRLPQVEMTGSVTLQDSSVLDSRLTSIEESTGALDAQASAQFVQVAVDTTTLALDKYDVAGGTLTGNVTLQKTLPELVLKNPYKVGVLREKFNEGGYLELYNGFSSETLGLRLVGFGGGAFKNYFAHNVGIGIEGDNTYALKVAGNSNVSGTLSAGVLSTTELSNSASIALKSNGFNSLYLTSTGRVGVNTTGPGKALDVVGGIQASSMIESSGSFKAYGSGGNFLRGWTKVGYSLPEGDYNFPLDVNGDISMSTDSGYLRLGTSAWLKPTAAGLLGLNVDPATEKLDVNGNVKASIFKGTGLQLTGNASLTPAAASPALTLTAPSSTYETYIYFYNGANIVGRISSDRTLGGIGTVRYDAEDKHVLTIGGAATAQLDATGLLLGSYGGAPAKAKLDVVGGIIASSSITANAGFYGEGDSLTFTNGPAVNYGRVTNTCTSATSCTATCSTGKVQGGGCYANPMISPLQGYPNADTTYLCESTVTGNITAYAVCAKAQ